MAHLASLLNIRESLFTKNQAPSAEELQVINATLARLQADLDSYTSTNIQDRAAAISALTSVRSSMRFIPDDVLGLIFEHATPWCLADGIAEDSFPPPSPGSLDAPWTLSHVCQNWRAISLSLPHLWNVFRMDLPERDSSSFNEKVHMIYRRSEPLLLRLHITNCTPMASVRLLLKSVHRWRCVRVGSLYKGSFEGDILSNLFPRLTHLSLSSDGPWDYSLFARIRAPCLRNLELLYARASDFLGRWFIPWEQITWYKSVDTNIDLIGRMVNLEEVDIIEGRSLSESLWANGGNGIAFWGSHDDATVLPQLTRLTHNNNHGTLEVDAHTWLFTKYNFTSLRTLIIVDVHRAYDEESRPRFAFSLPSVVEFSLAFGKADDIRNILRATPNVQALHIKSKRDLAPLVYCPAPGRPSVADLRSLKHLSFVLEGRSLKTLRVAALDEGITTLKLYELPLETIAFYSSTCRDVDGAVITERQWTESIKEGMAGSLGWWMQDDLRVLYHYGAAHRFP